MSRNETNR